MTPTPTPHALRVAREWWISRWNGNAVIWRKEIRELALLLDAEAQRVRGENKNTTTHRRNQ